MLRIPRRLKSTLHGRTFDAIVVGGGHNGLVAVSSIIQFGKAIHNQ